MKKEIIFQQDYDFSDEHFDKIKDSILDKLKVDFNHRSFNARSQDKFLAKELKVLQNTDTYNLETFGRILLNQFEEHYAVGSKKIRNIIEDFAPFTMDSKEEWIKRYNNAIENNETEFSHLGSIQEGNLILAMSVWQKENLDFETNPDKNPFCFFDLTIKQGKYYFEKLAKYQALHDYKLFVANSESNSKAHSEEQDTYQARNYTINRQIIALKYLLIELGLEMKSNNNTDLARFIHLLSAKEFTDISNSTIYKKLKSFNTSDKKELNDYNFVINRFESLNASPGSALDNVVRKLKGDIEKN